MTVSKASRYEEESRCFHETDILHENRDCFDRKVFSKVIIKVVFLRS